jgi:hypothetical protein
VRLEARASGMKLCLCNKKDLVIVFFILIWFMIGWFIIIGGYASLVYRA